MKSLGKPSEVLEVETEQIPRVRPAVNQVAVLLQGNTTTPPTPKTCLHQTG